MIEVGVILVWLIGAFFSFLLLYFVIRLAVTHAIRATRPSARADQVVNDHDSSHLDADGL